jgi:hypothetical protein
VYDSFHFLFCSLWEVGVELTIRSIRGRERRESTAHHMDRLLSESSIPLSSD